MSSKTYDFWGGESVFRKLLNQFVRMKQSLGFNYATETNTLKRFSKFTLKYTIKNHVLTKELVDVVSNELPERRQNADLLEWLQNLER